jgi:transposase-like protein
METGRAMIIRDCCSRCGSTRYKRNGHIHNGKQSHLCKHCGRQFVLQFEQRLESPEERALIERLLGDRLSLHGICRAVGMSMKWLLSFAVECYDAAPEHLNVHFFNTQKMCSFAASKP